MKRYIIRGPEIDGEVLYWNNVNGWVSRGSAGRYKRYPSPPMETTKIIEVQNKPCKKQRA